MTNRQRTRKQQRQGGVPGLPLRYGLHAATLGRSISISGGRMSVFERLGYFGESRVSVTR